MHISKPNLTDAKMSLPLLSSFSSNFGLHVYVAFVKVIHQLVAKFGPEPPESLTRLSRCDR